MNPQWPLVLPKAPLVRGFSEKAPALALRTPMDAGPAKVRRRFTAGVRVFNYLFKVRSTLVEIFDDFYLVDCPGGSLRFDWTHPRTGAAVSMRFVGEPPVYINAGGDWWEISGQMEILP